MGRRSPAIPVASRAVAKPDFAFTMDAYVAYALLSAAVNWAGGRELLEQVRFECDGERVSMTATNGHGAWLADEVPVDNVPEAVFSFGLCVYDANAVRRLISQRKAPKPSVAAELVKFKGAHGKACLRVGRFSFELADVDDATFPNVRRALPVRRNSHSFVNVHAGYLSLVAKSLPGGKGPFTPICVQAGAELDAIRFDGTVGDVKASVVLQPMRGEKPGALYAQERANG